MTFSQKPICVTSYNSTGFGPNTIKFVETLLLFSNILCLQEHFLQDAGDKKYSNTNKLRKSFPDHDMYITPAFKPDNRVCRGRAKGGLATMWHPSLTKYVSKIKCDNFRLLATKFSFPDSSLLIINTYFPCDPRTNEFDDSELLKVLTDIANTIQSAATHSVLIAGDLNCHFARNSRFTSTVQTFLEDLNLKIFWENPSDMIEPVDFTHQSFNNGSCSISTLDHFVSNEIVISAVQEAGVIHHPDNTSNHSPIFVKINAGNLKVDVCKTQSPPRTSWTKASEEARLEYVNTVAAKLQEVEIPACINCSDMHCTAHKDDITSYTIDVLEAVECAARSSLPTVGGSSTRSRSGKTVPGWNEFVQPYYLESKFWHGVWVSAGKPQEGQLLQIMRGAKYQYKYALRRVQRASNKIQNDKFVEDISRGGVNIFEEIKKFRGNKKTSSSTIDGEVGESNIANHFADIYSDLYNKDQLGDKVINLKEQLDMQITGRDRYEVCRVTESVVRQGLKLMKGGKSDAVFDFQSDCLTEGPPEVVTHLTNMIRLFISHGQVPDLILVCTLLPLVKDNLGDITKSENYRAIATGCQVLKLVDLVILILEREKLGCDLLQFGFEPKASTTMCSWIATAVIDQYNRKGSAVYSCAMDLSKAFDMVEWFELFRVLQARAVSPVFLRTLLYIYTHQSCTVKWNGSLSDSFKVSNGVRQGAVSSPILFSLYIDDLFSLLRSSGLGCRLNNQFYGCLGYADDLLLLSASRTGLQVMINKCAEFMKGKKLKFSTNVNPSKSKTKCVIFSKKAKDRINVLPVKLNGDDLPWVPEIKHLGNLLESNNSMKRDVTVKRGKFIGKINALSQEFFFSSPEVFMRILNIYTVSFYGSGLWDMYSDECDRIFKAWNVAVRSAWKVPYTTHRYLIEGISGCLHPKVLLACRYSTFVSSLLSSSKYPVRVLASLCVKDQRTTVGRTMSKIMRDCKLNMEDVRYLNSNLIKSNMKYYPAPEEEEWRVGCLDELLNNQLEIPGFDANELKDIVSFICSS